MQPHIRASRPVANQYTLPDLVLHSHVQFFTQWYLDKHEYEDVANMRESNTWGSESAQAREPFAMLKDDIIALRQRFDALEAFERETLNDLRNRNVSIPHLIDYLRAEPGFNPEGKPVRTDVASALRRQAFLNKSDRLESIGRASAIAAGAVVLLGVGSTVAASGYLPATAASIVALWAPKAWAAATSIIQAAAGGGAMIVAWKGWKQLNDLKRNVPRLDIGSDSNYTDLSHSLGNINYVKLNEQYESIVAADQHLIKHLSPTELRMFLMGKDATRLHILRANPPTSWSQIQSRLDPLINERTNIFRSALLATRALLTAPWSRENNNARISDLKQRMQNWREFETINKRYGRGGESPELHHVKAPK